MRVRALAGHWGVSPRGYDHLTVGAGEEVELPDEVAAAAIRDGQAEAVGPAKPARRRRAAETAAPETAAAPGAPETAANGEDGA